MKVLAAFALVLIVGTACTPAASRGGTAAPPPARPHLVWHTNLAGDVLEVEITDPNAYYRVERVALIGPNGETYTARETTRETVRDEAWPYDGGAGVGIGGGYGSHHGGSVGVGLSFPLGGPGGGPEVRRTRARIRLPDPIVAGGGDAAWVVEVALSDPAGRTVTARFPGPRPPQ